MESTPERKRYSKAEREDLLKRFDAAGLSAKAFARSEGIKYPTFTYWLKARREGERPQSFVEIERAHPTQVDRAIEIFLPDGIVLRTYNPACAASLAREFVSTC